MENLKISKSDKNLIKALRKYVKCRLKQNQCTFRTSRNGSRIDVVDGDPIDTEVLQTILKSDLIENLIEDKGFKPYIALVNEDRTPDTPAFKKYLILGIIKTHAKSKKVTVRIVDTETDEIKKIKIKLVDVITAFIRKLENDIIVGIKPTAKNSLAFVATIKNN